MGGTNLCNVFEKVRKNQFHKTEMFTFSRRRRFLTGRFWPLCPLSICLSRCYRAHNIRPEVHDKLFQCEAITWLRLFMQPFVLINVFIFKLKTLPLITAFIFKKLPVSARSQIPTVIDIWIFDFFFHLSLSLLTNVLIWPAEYLLFQRNWKCRRITETERFSVIQK